MSSIGTLYTVEKQSQGKRVSFPRSALSNDTKHATLRPRFAPLLPSPA